MMLGGRQIQKQSVEAPIVIDEGDHRQRRSQHQVNDGALPMRARKAPLAVLPIM